MNMAIFLWPAVQVTIDANPLWLQLAMKALMRYWGLGFGVRGLGLRQAFGHHAPMLY